MAEHLANARVVVTLALSVAIAYKAWENRPKRGAAQMAAFVGIVAYLQAQHLTVHLYGSRWGKYLGRLEWLGLGPIAFVLFAFVLAYTGREHLLSRRTYAALLAWPVFLNVVVWLPIVTGAFGQPVGASLQQGLDAQTNWVFWGHIGLSYGLLAVGSVLLVVHMSRTNELFRRQGALIVFGLAAAWAGSVNRVLGITDLHLDSLQLGFALLGIAFFVGVFYGGITDVVPVARSTILGNLAVGVLVVDEEERVTDLNPHARRMLDLAPNTDVLGEPVETVLADHPDLRDTIRNINDGDRELEIETGDGVRAVELDVSPLTDRTGHPIGTAVLLYDVTSQRRRQRELERQNEQLEQFASLVSHDLRNPLTVAGAYLGNARELASSEDLEAALAEIEASHDRMEDLIEDVLTLAREGRSVSETESVDLAAVAMEAWGHVDTTEATLSVETDARLDADRSRLLRLFENLFRNSVEHGGESVTVRVGDLAGDGGSGGFFVEDDGPGIPEDRREKVLEDGFTTADGGTGLGLSIVTSVVEAHGWEISVGESDEGGARFEIAATTTAESTPPVAEL